MKEKLLAITNLKVLSSAHVRTHCLAPVPARISAGLCAHMSVSMSTHTCLHTCPHRCLHRVRLHMSLYTRDHNACTSMRISTRTSMHRSLRWKSLPTKSRCACASLHPHPQMHCSDPFMFMRASRVCVRSLSIPTRALGAVFFSASRRMPTANAEVFCRSEGT